MRTQSSTPSQNSFSETTDMPIEIKMPALSPTMEKGTIARWLIAPGDWVKTGDLIAEIETDKATMELEAEQEGRLSEITVPGGSDDVAVGTVIALLASEASSEVSPAIAEDGSVPTSPAVPEVQPVVPAAEAPISISKSEPTPAPEQLAPQSAPKASSAVLATPLATRIAKINGIALEGIKGTGPRGKVVKADLGIPSLIAPPTLSTVFSGAPVPSPQPVLVAHPLAAAEPPAGVPVSRSKLSSMRKTIARRLSEAKQQIPHFYLTVRCNIDPLLELRQTLNQAIDSRGIKISVNDMLIKGMAIALEQVPDANVQFGGDELYRFGRADISMAVAIDGGLVTPVLRDVGKMSLAAIASQSKSLATKARDGKLVPQDYEGGTASISNLGMFGIDEMVPVINPPQAMILGAGAGVRQPWAVNGELALATVLTATASFDHRAIDGAVGAQFLAAFKAIIENPLLLCA
jgi:pyruvate dehydrogenase E2 component (dihydrolipoamide acetyltransferase)